MSVIVYRELANIPSHVEKWLDERGQLIVIQDSKKNSHYLIENDLPREPTITEAIVGGGPYGKGCTIGFALFTDEGDRIGSYRSLDRAIAAAETAKIVTSVEAEQEDEGFEWDSIVGAD
jgi:hypothetical protein